MRAGKMSKYFLSFIQEFWPGQLPDTWIGRIEYHVIGSGEKYPDELGFGTKDRAAVERLRDKYDFEEVDEETWEEIKKEVEKIRGHD